MTPSDFPTVPHRRWPSLALLILALLSGIAWRAELELRGGWASLTWISYFHWAVPTCVLAFIVWVLCVTQVERLRDFAITLVVFAWLAHAFVDLLIHYSQSGGPFWSWYVFTPADPLARLAMHFLRSLPRMAHSPEAIVFFKGIVVLCWLLVPLGFSAMCRAFGVRMAPGPVWLSSLLFVISWPLAILLLEITGRRGGPNLIHALKSGFVIPFLVFSLGLPVLMARSAAK